MTTYPVRHKHHQLAVFHGQSLNDTPAPPGDYPTLCVAGTRIVRVLAAHGGYTMEQLQPYEPSEVDPYANLARKTAALICTGSSDIWDGESGVGLYAEHVAWAARRRAAGFDKVIACTLVGNQTNTSPQNTERLGFNVLLLADASAAFDDVVDLDATALATWTDGTYYQGDGIHWKAAGAQLAADTIRPVLVAQLA